MVGLKLDKDRIDDYSSLTKVDWKNPRLDENNVGQNVVGLKPFGPKLIWRKVGLPPWIVYGFQIGRAITTGVSFIQVEVKSKPNFRQFDNKNKIHIQKPED